MSFYSRHRALSRLARQLDHQLHDHHIASYSLFRPTTYTNYTLSPFHISPVEDLFRPFQSSIFKFLDNEWDVREIKQKKNRKQTEAETENNKNQATTQERESGKVEGDKGELIGGNNQSTLQSTHPHHQSHNLSRFPLSRYNRHPFDSPFFSSFPFPYSSIVPSITLNLYSTPSNYQIKAELPGVKKEEIVISVEKGILTIEAERKEEKGDKQRISQENNNKDNSSTDINDAKEKASSTSENLSSSSSSSLSSNSSSESPLNAVSPNGDEPVEDIYVESHYGKVTRSVSLPDDASFDGLTAKYENGVIKIEIPRKQIPKEKKTIVQLQ